MTHTHKIDLTEGSLTKSILLFSLPVMFSGMLQQLYNAADTVMVGRLAGDLELAAVGSTGSLVALMVGLFFGFSVGASILISASVGARDDERTSHLAHATIAVSLVCGLVVTAVAMIFADVFLTWLGTPADIFVMAGTYLRIYFSGTVFQMLYNFGSAILRASGDSSRPSFYLAVSGIVNIVFNYVFVAWFHMGVAGVALATVISQALSAILVMVALLRASDACRIIPSRIRLHPRETKEILLTGLPAGLQSSLFSLSNTVVQGAVNSLGTAVVAGSAAAANVESIIWHAMNAFHVAAVTSVGQNVGAKRYERINRAFVTCLWMVTVAGLFFGTLLYLFQEPLLTFYLPDSPESVAAGMGRISTIAFAYVLCGLMDTAVGAIRGMGSTLAPMIVSMSLVISSRLLWVMLVFPHFNTLAALYVCFPVSWILATAGQIIVFVAVRRRLVGTVQKAPV